MGDSAHAESTPNILRTVVKAGSAASPAVLSPDKEHTRQLTHARVESSLDQVLLTSWDPPSFSYAEGHIPLASPTEQPESSTRPLLMRGAGFSMVDAIPGDGELPTPPAISGSRGALRLPSFHSLGIANRFPDGLSPYPRPSPFGMDGTGSISSLAGNRMSGAAAPFIPGIQSPFQLPGFSPLTPPDEVTSITLTPYSNEGLGPTSAPSAPASDAPYAVAGNSEDLHTSSVSEIAPAPINRASQFDGALHNVEPWLRTAVLSVLDCVASARLPNHQMRVLSHALPSPLIPGHAFPTVIDCVRTQLPPHPVTWINVFHAVPGRFNLADLPTSPPNTPGIPFGGAEDYFTARVFDSAVPITDYESEATPVPHDHPQPAVPPSSVNLSIVERLIPPASRREFADLFDPNSSRSILADRLIELSPNNGCLVFIYPTRQGGQTFLDDYLSPVLDPILRSMVVVHGFSANFSSGLGQMAAVDHLHTFSAMEMKLKRFCNELSQSNSGILERLHGTSQALFTVEYAGKHGVTPTREVWTNWWMKQEKARIRSVVNKNFAQWNNIYGHGQDLSHAHLIQEILDGVKKRREPSPIPTPIEVGVFVLKRQQ